VLLLQCLYLNEIVRLVDYQPPLSWEAAFPAFFVLIIGKHSAAYFMALRKLVDARWL